MADDVEQYCEIYQHGELYTCGVSLRINGEEYLLGSIKCDKIRITYNTNLSKFIVRFVYGAMRLVESHVDRIAIYDMEKENKITFPDIDTVWPYDKVQVEMKED